MLKAGSCPSHFWKDCGRPENNLSAHKDLAEGLGLLYGSVDGLNKKLIFLMSTEQCLDWWLSPHFDHCMSRMQRFLPSHCSQRRFHFWVQEIPVYSIFVLPFVATHRTIKRQKQGLIKGLPEKDMVTFALAFSVLLRACVASLGWHTHTHHCI